MRGAIFDVDGVLLDSMGVWHKITDRFFRAHGLTLSDEQAASYKDMTLEESLPLINEKYNLKMSFDEMYAQFRSMVAEEYKYNIALKPYAREYLKSLHDAGIKIAVATSGYEGMCADAFERTGIINYIDAYTFSSEVGCNKSKPDIYLLAARRIGENPTCCTVYEDIVPGIRSASEAGFRTCAVYDETNADETDVLKRLSDRYITGWKELL